ncbi:MAG: hypothetical protein LBS01_04875 [Prevotellaceae bacterium]|jgi:hypothetical protein|nr:hypothetical protein [Prevotellaceae bacterium]
MKYSVLIIVTTLLLSCCAGDKDGQQAANQFAEIEHLVNSGKYNAAVLALDSFHLRFPKQIELRRRALTLEDSILRQQNRRTVAYCDSLMAVYAQKRDSMSSLFLLEKDAKYQIIGSFIYKKQIKNTYGTEIKVSVDEKNDFHLVKYNFGIKNLPAFLTVAAADLYASTDTLALGSEAFHSFEADGSIVESVTFSNAQAAKFAAFVKKFVDKNLTVTQHGKKNINHILSENEKQSIAITYTFWKLKKEIQNLENEKQKALKKLGEI